MRWKRTLTAVGVHAEGEYAKVVTGGVVDVPGRTMFDKMRWLAQTRRRAQEVPALRAARRGRPQRQHRPALQQPEGGARLRDHGVDGVPADVGLQHDLHGHGDPGDGHPPDAGAGDAAHAGGAGGAHRGDLPLRGRPGAPGEVPERAGVRPAPRRARRGARRRHGDAGRRLRRHALRARRRRRARVRDHAGRGAGHLRHGREDPGGGARPAPRRAPGESRRSATSRSPSSGGPSAARAGA